MHNKDVSTIADAIEYFNTHPSLFKKEENDKGHMERVMSVLTQENMENLEKEFQLYSRGLELPTFIYLIKKLYVPDHEYSKYFFVSDLIKFFQAIDINGDGHLQWSQFTQYIIENIRVVEKPKYKNRAYEQNQIISSAYSKISNEYRISKIIDLNFQSAIKKIIYSEDAKMYYVQESQSSCLKIFDSHFKCIDTINLQAKSMKSSIIDFSLDKNNVVMGCIFEDCLHFCNLKVKSTVKCVNKQESPQFKDCGKIEYLHKSKTWSVLTKSGGIILMEISYNSRTLLQMNIVKNINQHDSMITSIIEIDDPKCIATSSMDGQIKLYSRFLQKNYVFEHIYEQTPSAINDKMRKGILGLSYTGQFGNYMISYSFSFQIYIYCLDISITKGYVGKYTEHTGPIKWAKFLKGFPYVISFDEKLNMRIWDFRKFQTIQFINCEKHFINPSCLQIVTDLNQILICEKKITQFLAQALDKKSKQINQFHNIFDFKFCPHTNSVFVFTSNDVRVYNYYTGTLKKLFTKLYQSNYETNITACQFGFKCKRFFVGDAGGFVREFCSETGECLQDINPSDDLSYENKQIVSIIFLKDFSLLICCSIDGRIMIYERDDSGDYIIIRDLRECYEELACVAASSRYCLLATSGEDGTVNIWNLQKYLLEGTCVVTGKPIAMAFSPIHPILLVACSDGFINLIYVRPYEGRSKYKCFARISINEQEKQQQIVSFSFDLMINAYFPKNNVLNCDVKGNHHLIVCVGTKEGSIFTFNMNKILELYEIGENHKIFIIKNFQRCEIQIMKGVIINERNRILLNGYSNTNVPTHELKQFPNFIIKIEEGPVQNVLISKQNSAIFTKSTDKKMKVWSFNSEYNGAINFSTFKKTFWKIPQINFHKKLQSIDTTIYSIKLIENRKFDPAQEERIKVHLLLNQYLTNKQKQDYMAWLTEKRKKDEKDDEITENQQIVAKNKKGFKSKGGNMEEEIISEQEFNQIYSKLVTSIKKSIDEYENSEKIFWEEKTESGKPGGKASTKDDFFEVANQLPILQNKKGGKRKTILMNQSLKMTGLLSNKEKKVDMKMQLFGKKQNNSRKKENRKKNNILFTSLASARKVIESHEIRRKKLI